MAKMTMVHGLNLALRQEMEWDDSADILHEEDGVEAEVIDLLTLSPLDHETFVTSVRKTGRAVTVHEAARSFGPATEIMACLVAKAFWYLEGPVRRVTGFDTAVPPLGYEQAYLPSLQRIVHAARLAMAFRQQFKCDVMIDLWCYRRYGHNENDDATFMQPLMYQEFAAHPSVVELYTQRLAEAGEITAEAVEQIRHEVRQRLDAAREVARQLRPRQRISTLGGVWRV